MKTVFLSLSFLLVMELLSPANHVGAQEADAEAIVKKADEKFRGESSKGLMRMSIVRPKWERTIEMKSWSLGTEYFMVYITAPAKEKGQAYLKRENEMWQWLPSIERMVKLPPSMMMQSWMGSDFTNDDLMQESSIIRDYEKELLSTESLQGYECHKIELAPKPEAVVVWDKILLWISKDDYYQLKAEYYDEFGDLVQTMTGSNIKTLDDRKLPATLTIEPADKSGHKTILEYVEMDFDIDIEASFFSQQRMKRLH
ncbi:MAG: outer membrane lipoprotein-sorting protein [Bacteroidales bacterium]|nr:outer membrane lipoprotein-sorting protein [Bacteroidales bacterium]